MGPWHRERNWRGNLLEQVSYINCPLALSSRSTRPAPRSHWRWIRRLATILTDWFSSCPPSSKGLMGIKIMFNSEPSDEILTSSRGRFSYSIAMTLRSFNFVNLMFSQHPRDDWWWCGDWTCLLDQARLADWLTVTARGECFITVFRFSSFEEWGVVGWYLFTHLDCDGDRKRGEKAGAGLALGWILSVMLRLITLPCRNTEYNERISDM